MVRLPTAANGMVGVVKRRELPPSLRALGRRDPPPTVRVGQVEYALRRTFKHDFFAATAMYESPADDRVIVKFGRRADFLGLPMCWAGRLLVRHETEALRRLAGVDGVPRLIEQPRRGRGDAALALVREFVEGEVLRKGRAVPDDFFARLAVVLDAIHERDMAYVDLEKPENVLVGEDGRPWLFDFQISWCVPPRWGGRTRLARWIGRRFQSADRYHLLKLRRRIRLDQLTPEEIETSYRRPVYVRWHNWLIQPFQRIRRRTLERLDPRRRVGERGRVETPETEGATT